MGKTYSAGVPVGTGFKLNDNSPIDDRTVVDTYADLSTLGYKHYGMTVFVRDISEEYIWQNVNEVTGWFPKRELKGESYAFCPNNDPDPGVNKADFILKYDALALTTPYGLPLSDSNRATIIIAPGKIRDLTLNHNFINVVSLTNERDVFVAGGITINAQYFDIVGLYTEIDMTIVFNTETTTDFYITIKNCKGAGGSFYGGNNIIYDNCEAGNASFSGYNNIYKNCISGNNSFISETDSKFINCTAGYGSFLGDYNNMKNCEAGNDSFQGSNLTINNCNAGDNSFIHGDYNNMKNCEAGDNSFYGDYLTINNCNSGTGSFFTGDSSTLKNCNAGNNSFYNIENDLIQAQHYYCSIRGGTFKNIGEGGTLKACVDDNMFYGNLFFIP